MKNVLKWAALILVGLAVILILGGIVITSVGNSKANEQFNVTSTLLSEVHADSLSIARGEHLAKIHGCAECHTESFGGQVFIDAPPFLVIATNLTSGKGGIGADYSIQDWDRAIRYGVKPDGRSTLVMPSKTLHNLSDDDTRSIIAYLKTVPPIDNELPASEIRTLGKVLVAAGELDPASEVHLSSNRSQAPPEGVTTEYGKYLSSITCTHCHGANMEGGPPVDPQAPPSPALKASGEWSFEQFKTAMTTGRTPSEYQLDADYMPWKAFAHMTDEELQAIQLYLQSL